MKVISRTAPSPLATVLIGRMANGELVEFVQALQPPFPRQEKWILMISTLYGCPVGCPICDAGGEYRGPLSEEDMWKQIRYLVRQDFPDGVVQVRKFKIQLARMGEPALNDQVLDLLESLPRRLTVKGDLVPSVSTIAPRGRDSFFYRLAAIKDRHYSKGNFQLQFSLHSTDSEERDRLIPVKKWDFARIGEYGKEFHKKGDRKISLNVAWGRGQALDPEVICRYFSPERFLIKITPVNPTVRARENRIETRIDSPDSGESLPPVQRLRELGYRVIVSIGQPEENRIGSNCGQYIRRYRQSVVSLDNAYTYRLD